MSTPTTIDCRLVDEHLDRLFSEPAGELPEAVRAHLDEAARIAVEIRPEGVLLRPEMETEDDTGALLQDMLPQHRNGSSGKRRRWPFRHDGHRG